MATETAFEELIRRVRAGEEKAAEELVRRFQPDIERITRRLMTSFRLTRLLDPSDISQTVFTNFFIRVSTGQFDLREPEQLRKLLTTMARHEIMDQARWHQAQCRDTRRMEHVSPDHFLDVVIDAGPTPSKIVAGHELVTEIYHRLTPEEQFVLEQRALRREWADIAEELQVSAEALRKRMARSVDRIMRELEIR